MHSIRNRIIIVSLSILTVVSVMITQSQEGIFVEDLHLGRGAINAIAWRPDGEVIAVGAADGLWLYDNTLQLIGQLDKRPLRGIEPGNVPMNTLAWNPDNRHLAVDYGDGIQVWDTQAGEIIDALPDSDCPLAWSPDGVYLATGTPDSREVLIWDAAHSNYITTYNGHVDDDVPSHRQGIGAIAWTLDGTQIISTGSSWSTVDTWDAMTGETILKEGRVITRRCSIARSWSPDRTRYGLSVVHDPPIGEPLLAISTNSILVDFKSADWSPDGAKIAVISSEQVISIWDVTTTGLLMAIDMKSQQLIDEYILSTNNNEQNAIIQWSPDGKQLLTSWAGNLSLWDVETGERTASVFDHVGWTNAVTWSSDGQLLATGHGQRQLHNDARIRLWDANTGELARTCEGHSVPIISLDWREGTSIITSGVGDYEYSNFAPIWFWNADECVREGFVQMTVTLASNLSWNPDDTRLATNVGRSLVFWDELSNEISGIHDVQTYSWSPDGTQIATGSDHLLHIRDSVTHEIVMQVGEHEMEIVAIAWHPDGSMIASASNDGVVRLWDVESSQLLLELAEHDGEIVDIGWHPQEMVLATAGIDGIRFWDMDTGQQLAVVEGADVRDIEWSPDGTRLASAHYLNGVHVYTWER
jgi:WD40 repeat protein